MILVETYIDEDDIDNRDVVLGFTIFEYFIDKWVHDEYHTQHLGLCNDTDWSWLNVPENLVSNHICY